MDKINIIIIFLFIVITLLYVFRCKQYKNEHFANLIDNGNFKEGKMSPASAGNTVGNAIIKLANPGKSSYVLEQTASDNHGTFVH